MRPHSALLLLLLTANFSRADSPVLPIELISRNAQGQQQITYNGGALSGMSALGNKIAFTVTDRAFFNEPPAPPIIPGSFNIPVYGQIALWQRGRAPLPLIDFRDGFGPANSPDGYDPARFVKLSEESTRVCFPVESGDLVIGIRIGEKVAVFCSAQAGPPYQYLPGPVGTSIGFAQTGVFGNERFDLYGGVFLTDPDDQSSGGLWLQDRQTNLVERVALANDGHIAMGGDMVGVSDNGRWVVFQSGDNSLTDGDTGTSFGWNGFPGNDFFIRDRIARTTRRVLRPNGLELLGEINRYAAISANGRFLVFSSTGDVVAPCLTNDNGMPQQGLNPEPMFVHDFQTNSTECITLTQSGQAFSNTFGSFDSRVSISGDGRFVAYSTRYPADPNDTNNKSDIYLRDRKLNRTIWVSQAADGAPGNSRSISPLISQDGRWLAFESFSSNLVPNDTNLQTGGNPFFQGGDVFLRDLTALSIEPVQVPAASNWGWALLVLGIVASLQLFLRRDPPINLSLQHRQGYRAVL